MFSAFLCDPGKFPGNILGFRNCARHGSWFGFARIAFAI